MTLNDDSQERFLDLASRFLDGALGETETRELSAILEKSPAARRTMARLVNQHGTLRWTRIDKGAVPVLPRAGNTTRRIALRKASPKPAALWFSAAASLAFAATLGWFAFRPKEQTAPIVVEETPAEQPVVRIPVPPAPAPKKAVAPAPAPVAPRPESTPAPEAPAPRVRETIPALAEVEKVRGEVYVLSEGKKTLVEPGQGIVLGQGIETMGAGSRVILKFPDSSRLELGPETMLSKFAPEKHMTVSRGKVAADVTRQEGGKFLTLVTPQAQVTASEAYVTVVCTENSTELGVEKGSARLERRADGVSAEVAAGSSAAVAPGIPFPPKLLAAGPQDRRPAKDGINPKDVDLAIKKGVAFLKTQGMPGCDGNGLPDCAELKLWTYIHAYPDILETDPQFKELLEKILKDPLAHTYKVSLQAMCLEELDRVRYQERIAQCAQALIDAQCGNGQWSYPAAAEPVKFSPVPTPKGVETQKVGAKPKDPKAKPMGRIKPTVRQLIPIKRQGARGDPSGDNSNSQYAALGLRACHDAGIVLPKEVIEKARKWWLDSQIKGGAAPGQGKNDVQTSGNAYYPPAGWGYGGEAQAWGSMTVGAVGGLCLYDYILDGEKKESWKRDAAVRMGIEWLAKNFTVTENPSYPGGATWHYYYLYGLERAAVLFGTENLGAHAWYAEGARYLLKEQKANGSWLRGAGEWNLAVHDTCFAILFLKRATRPLHPDVATGPNVRPDVPQDR